MVMNYYSCFSLALGLTQGCAISGPDLDMEVRRTQFASPDVWKMAMKQPEGTKKKKVKNQSSNLFGETLGRLHLEKQNLDKMGGRKSKALRKAARWEKEEEMADIENDLANEKETLNTEMKQVFGFHTDELD
jgi:ribosome production factor 2